MVCFTMAEVLSFVHTALLCKMFLGLTGVRGEKKTSETKPPIRLIWFLLPETFLKIICLFIYCVAAKGQLAGLDFSLLLYVFQL